MSNFQLAGPGDVFLGQNVTDLVDPILCNRNITWHFYQDSSYQAISQVDTPGEHRTSEGSPASLQAVRRTAACSRHRLRVLVALVLIPSGSGGDLLGSFRG